MTNSRLIIEASDIILDENIKDTIRTGAKNAYVTIRQKVRKIIENLKLLYSKILVELNKKLVSIKLDTIKKNIDKYDDSKLDTTSKSLISGLSRIVAVNDTYNELMKTNIEYGTIVTKSDSGIEKIKNKMSERMQILTDLYERGKDHNSKVTFITKNIDTLKRELDISKNSIKDMTDKCKNVIASMQKVDKELAANSDMKTINSSISQTNDFIKHITSITRMYAQSLSDVGKIITHNNADDVNTKDAE